MRKILSLFVSSIAFFLFTPINKLPATQKSEEEEIARMDFMDSLLKKNIQNAKLYLRDFYSDERMNQFLKEEKELMNKMEALKRKIYSCMEISYPNLEQIKKTPKYKKGYKEVREDFAEKTLELFSDERKRENYLKKIALMQRERDKKFKEEKKRKQRSTFFSLTPKKVMKAFEH